MKIEIGDGLGARLEAQAAADGTTATELAEHLISTGLDGMDERTAPRKLYTVDEAAKQLRMTPRTLGDYLRSGRIRGIKAGRSWRITEAAIQEFMNG